MTLASCSSFSGPRTAGPRTTPLVPAVQELVPKVSAFDLRLDHPARPGAAVEADRELAPLLEPGVLDARSLEPVAGPFAGVLEVVRAGQPRADPVGEEVEVVHHLRVLAAGGDDPLDLQTLALGDVLLPRDRPSVGTATTIAATHPAQNCRLMRNLRSMMTEKETPFP